MISTNGIVTLLALMLAAARPTRATGEPPVPAQASCPRDSVDTLHADGRTYRGITAQRYVEGFLSSSPQSGGRARTGTGNVSTASVRLLTDPSDSVACRSLTRFISNGARSDPPSPVWVYFTAGGFYFVSQWTPARSLANASTGYGTVMVFDSAFNFLGAYTA